MIAPLPRQTNAVPEPSELMLMGTGLMMMAGQLKRGLKRRKLAGRGGPTMVLEGQQVAAILD